jgi:hypothetical protein
MALETVRFGVQLERQTEGAFAEIGQSIEGRKKTDFHRVVIKRIVRLWGEKPEELEKLGIIRRVY